MRWPCILLMCVLTAPAVGATVEATVLNYREWEPERPAYEARVIVTPDYMRQDYGSDDPDFVLLDRRAGAIYSVQSQDRRILEIGGGSVAPATRPSSHRLDETSHDFPDMPAVEGRQPLVTDYRVDGEVCYRTASVPGLLPDVVAAWSQFRRILAIQQAATLHHTPAALRDTCQVANDIEAPVRHLQHGLPLREDNHAGLSRELLSYEVGEAVDGLLFELPADYQRFRIEPAGE